MASAPRERARNHLRHVRHLKDRRLVVSPVLGLGSWVLLGENARARAPFHPSVHSEEQLRFLPAAE